MTGWTLGAALVGTMVLLHLALYLVLGVLLVVAGPRRARQLRAWLRHHRLPGRNERPAATGS